MAYIIEKKIPEAMQERIFRETKQARNSVGTGYWLDDEEFLVDIQNSNLPCAIDYDSSNYILGLNSEGDCEPLKRRYLFYYNNNCYLFCTEHSFSNELMFFAKTLPPSEQIELFQMELEKVFGTVGRDLSGWTNDPFTHIYPVISTILTKEW